MSETNEEQTFEDAFDELAEETSSSSASTETTEEVTANAEEEGQEEEGVREAELLEPEPEPEPEQEPAPELTIEEKLDAAHAEIQQLTHKYNSDLGRQNAYQRQLQERDQQILQLQRQQQQSQPKNPGISNERWKVVAEDYPDIAQGVQAIFEEQTKRHEAQLAAVQDQVQRELAPIQQQAHQTYVDQQFAVLEQEHPDYREIAGSDDFKGWVGAQPEPIQALMKSEQAGDAAYLLRAYKNEMNPGQQATSELKQRNQAKLRQAQTVPSRGGRAQTQMPPDDDFDAAFEFFASKA